MSAELIAHQTPGTMVALLLDIVLLADFTKKKIYQSVRHIFLCKLLKTLREKNMFSFRIPLVFL